MPEVVYKHPGVLSGKPFVIPKLTVGILEAILREGEKEGVGEKERGWRQQVVLVHGILKLVDKSITEDFVSSLPLDEFIDLLKKIVEANQEMFESLGGGPLPLGQMVSQ